MKIEAWMQTCQRHVKFEPRSFEFAMILLNWLEASNDSTMKVQVNSQGIYITRED